MEIVIGLQIVALAVLADMIMVDHREDQEINIISNNQHKGIVEKKRMNQRRDILHQLIIINNLLLILQIPLRQPPLMLEMEMYRLHPHCLHNL